MLSLTMSSNVGNELFDEDGPTTGEGVVGGIICLCNVAGVRALVGLDRAASCSRRKFSVGLSLGVPTSIASS